MVSLSVENWTFGRFPPSFCISYQFWVDFVCSSTHSLVVLENLLVASEVAQRKFKSSNFAYNLSTFLLASQNPKLIDCKFQFHKTTTNEISSNYRNWEMRTSQETHKIMGEHHQEKSRSPLFSNILKRYKSWSINFFKAELNNSNFLKLFWTFWSLSSYSSCKRVERKV